MLLKCAGRFAATAVPVPTHSTTAPPSAMDAPPRTGSCVDSAPSSKDLSKPPGDSDMVEFVPKEDLASDEAVWALYERWCKAFNQNSRSKREPDEMARRFNKFKDRVLHIHNVNNANPSCKLVLTKFFSDGKLAELRANRDPHVCLLGEKYSNSSLLWQDDGTFLREVFADFDMVNGKLFVFFSLEKGESVGHRKEVSVEYRVMCGRLFADLPEGHELVAFNLSS